MSHKQEMKKLTDDTLEAKVMYNYNFHKILL
jgi:hypothetical protein